MEIAKIYGVCDRTVRNWIVKRSLSVQKVKYSNISNEQLEEEVKTINCDGKNWVVNLYQHIVL